MIRDKSKRRKVERLREEGKGEKNKRKKRVKGREKENN